MSNKNYYAFLKRISCIFITIVSCHQASLEVKALDFDNDGLSDFTYVEIGSKGLEWQAFSSSALTTSQLLVYGKNGDHLIAGSWQGQENVIGTISSSNKRSTDLVWTLLTPTGQLLSSFTLGNFGDQAISGADFDGNGELDAAAVSKTSDGKKYLWKIKLNPLTSPDSAIIEKVFGSSKDSVFYFSYDGLKDRIATIGKDGRGEIIIKSRDISSTKVFSLKPKKSLKLPTGITPQPVKAGSGADILAFVRKGRIDFFKIDSPRFAPLIYSGNTQAVIGNFSSQIGHEIALLKSNGALIYNPEAKLKEDKIINNIPQRAIFFDQININEVKGSSSQTPEPAPIGTPNTSPTPTSPGNPALCAEQETRDMGGGFVWKPVSDTQRFAVAVFRPELTGIIARVDSFTTSGIFINNLPSKGAGNGNRTAWQDKKYTGYDYANQFGQIILVGVAYDGSCMKWVIDTPNKRID